MVLLEIIETYWNVNQEPEIKVETTAEEIIETYWNVNEHHSYLEPFFGSK